MRIVTLMENTHGAEGCAFGHGLSLFIETSGRRILLDAGPDESFASNAALLGVDLTSVDICVLSHGHYDHAGGLLKFAELDPHAPIYLQRAAALDYYADDPGNLHYIGIDKAIATLSSARLLEGDADIGGGLRLLAGVHGRRLLFAGNARLKQRLDGRLIADAFAHEQALAVEEGGRHFLFSGCSHLGIVNWMDRFREAFGRWSDAAVGGFHFMKKAPYSVEEEATIRQTARELAATGTLFYTGHCTGEKAFVLMAEIMGDSLRALHSGAVFSL